MSMTTVDIEAISDRSRGPSEPHRSLRESLSTVDQLGGRTRGLRRCPYSPFRPTTAIVPNRGSWVAKSVGPWPGALFQAGGSMIDRHAAVVSWT
jgi:hypothetical protein